ncbi:hypothetical protein BN159_4755 [Streptomyces davaonensis JCM 4913]|uniref:DUF1330 domain-containing protein n=1 Tax=Streptomyces davaonensis (strain DSM 101723 / JCM 4913 / KCC S-0913 / 768) TaxID=1214101 RepID=K4R8W9_STRDJ|nr:DUF1330 domain-containing protein [Streptomyces davaonensis]CCK29134.1 hypothetical protein BN159_4755 [Streptomyces davaonensis JCM 4913]
MTAYAIAHLREITPHVEIAEYIERIGATFEPYGGRFLVHGVREQETVEGCWPGDVVMIEFPGIAEAREWWDSPAYRDIAPLRSRHITGDIILVQGVAEDYDPATTAQALRDGLDGDA